MSPSLNLLPGTKAGLRSAQASTSFYWIPSAIDFPGVDSVLGDGEKNLYALQATNADSHKSPIDGLCEVWKRVDKDLRQSCSWNFVAVADTAETAQKLLDSFSQDLMNVRLGRKKVPVKTWACVLR
ncbi:hypothetical protein EXIGLDRAFT_781105 [Exidia glandulosa HHB12029]|uniref:Uncharacterized protein n=1 Tax=Exidia glandulosa HHB12029 TaxID=1314781 RepID=A0A165Z8M4_EXIGL|nr:hypothetical protein EXIGLDRAFT_781105 [Exidia glandulosa HHB12029]